MTMFTELKELELLLKNVGRGRDNGEFNTNLRLRKTPIKIRIVFVVRITLVFVLN